MSSGEVGAEYDDNELKWLLNLMLDYELRGKLVQTEPLDLSNQPYFLEDLRDAYEAFTDGNTLAVLDALEICRSNSLPLPDWIANGLTDIIVDAVSGKSLGKKGRANSPLAQAREALKVAKRTSYFGRIRVAQQIPLVEPFPSGNFAFAFMLPPETSILLASGKIKSLGSTRSDALEILELSLRGTFAQTSLATLTKMMTKYESEIGYEISDQTLERFGLAPDRSKELLEPGSPLNVLEILNFPSPDKK